jgi:ribosomal protein S18 acetylase RimI-like enzyme
VSDRFPILFADPAARAAIRTLDPALDEEAAAILAAATGAGTVQHGREVLAALRRNEAVELYGLFVGEELVAIYTLRRDTPANEITHLAVKEGERRKGYGRACLQDALRRSGSRPLTVETDEDAVAFYKTCGFKIIGRRKHPSGTLRYRLGWHAPARRGTGQDARAES